MKYENRYQENLKTSARSYLVLALGCFMLSLLISLAAVQKNREALADRIAPSVLRFHILADSDEPSDQLVKLEIRSLILDYVQKFLPADADKEDTIRFLSGHKREIETAADQYLEQQGFGYQARLSLTRCYFPTRVYGAYVFPCGTYDAVRVILGSGSGHNWWCVLYPRFCFTDAVCSEVPAQSLERLRQTIKQDDYLALEDRRPELQIGFRLFPDVTITVPAASTLPPQDR